MATASSSADQHFCPDWATLSFLDDSNDDEDVEVTKMATSKIFDPVVGGRHSVRSSSSRSSAGSTGFYDTVELSPTTSLSPFAYDQIQDYDDNSLNHVMSNFQGLKLGDLQRETTQNIYNPPPPIQTQPNIMTSNQSQFLANLAALAQMNTTSLTLNNSMWMDTSLQGSNNLGNRFEKPATMQIRNKFGALGDQKGQFHSPHGFCMGPNEEIIVADTYNHRIQIFDKDSNFKFSFGHPGKEEGMLWYPRKVAVLPESGHYVICDRGNERSRMQIFSQSGHFIRRIPIRFIDIVAGLAISRDGLIVAVDSVTPTIFILHENGQLVKYIDCAEHMTEPSDIAIFNREYYVCDFKGHSIVVMHENGNFLRRINCQPVTNFPNGIDISDAGDILVGDSHGNMFHVAVYDRGGSLISQFQCPQVKVSRCCGLKITSEGYIVTLAKNNHHVLILNTLYVP